MEFPMVLPGKTRDFHGYYLSSRPESSAAETPKFHLVLPRVLPGGKLRNWCGQIHILPAFSQVITWYSRRFLVESLLFPWVFPGYLQVLPWGSPGYFQVLPWGLPGGALCAKNPGFYQVNTRYSGSGGKHPGFSQGNTWGFPVFQENRKYPG